MRRITTVEARERFGDLLDELRLDTPIGEEDGSFFLVEDGEPVGVVIGREGLHQIMEQQDEWLKAAIAEGMADIEAGRVVELTDELLEDIHRRGTERLRAEGKLPKDAA